MMVNTTTIALTAAPHPSPQSLASTWLNLKVWHYHHANPFFIISSIIIVSIVVSILIVTLMLVTIIVMMHRCYIDMINCHNDDNTAETNMMMLMIIGMVMSIT